MLKINCLATGSKGNCYLIQVGSSYFMLDAGLSIKEITSKVIKATYSTGNMILLSDLDFVFISHIHKDHSEAMQAFTKRNQLVLDGTVNGDVASRTIVGKRGATYRTQMFPLEHGETVNHGLVINTSDEFDKYLLLYATDFSICKPNLKSLKFTHVMVECNYVEELITNTEDIKARRQINTHMGLEGLCSFLDGLDLSRCQEIVLMHISDGYGDMELMLNTISKRYGIKTGICKKNGGILYQE